jgi:hypothetical protein
MQAPVEARDYRPIEAQAASARRYRWITALFALLASLSGLLAHALAPALLIAWWQDTLPSTGFGVVTAWALFIGSFLVASTLVAVCAFFAARAASERTGRRGSGLAAAAIVATSAAIALALGGVAAILLQASPLTAVNSPPLGVAALPYHARLAEGLALFYCAAYLPLLLLASATGLPGATRGARVALRARAGATTTALPQTIRRVA